MGGFARGLLLINEGVVVAMKHWIIVLGLGISMVFTPLLFAEEATVIKTVVEAELSSHDANFQRGMLYYSGEGAMPKNYRNARAAFEASAEAGNPNAQLMLGHMLTDGQGGGKDVNKGLWWIQKAADQELINAQFALAIELHGMKRDRSKQAQSFYWAKKAAVNQHVRAYTLLGMLYTEGIGTPIDYKAAKDAFEFAARRGESLAQLKLGLMYKLGLGTQQQFSTAYAWLSLAEENGQDKARPFIDEIESEMRRLVREDAQTQLKQLRLEINREIHKIDRARKMGKESLQIIP